jgi:hypothetical protein
MRRFDSTRASMFKVDWAHMGSLDGSISNKIGHEVNWGLHHIIEGS